MRKVPQQDWLSRYSAFLFFPVTVNVQNKKTTTTTIIIKIIIIIIRKIIVIIIIINE